MTYRPMVTDEMPVSICHDILPEYIREGIALDCGIVKIVRRGKAHVSVNFETIEETVGSVVVLSPGDIVSLDDYTDDLDFEYMAFTPFLQDSVLAQMEKGNTEVLRRPLVVKSEQLSIVVSGMLDFIRPMLDCCSAREIFSIAEMQLRAFYTFYAIVLHQQDIQVGEFRNRTDEVFYKFRQLLMQHYRTSRSVAFYADRLNITTRYLSGIVRSHSQLSPKDAINLYTVMQIRLDLLHSDKPISEIVWDYNFSSFSFFTEFFRRHTGFTTEEYRRKFR